TAAMHALIAAMPAPVWARDDAGKLTFANHAYARGAEAKDASEVMERGIELFEHGARTELSRAHEAAAPYSGRLTAVVAGERRNFEVATVPAGRGSAGIAVDVTEAELMRAELKRMMDAHRRTLQAPSTNSRRGVGSSDPPGGFPSTTAPAGRFGISTRASSTRDRPAQPCSAG